MQPLHLEMLALYATIGLAEIHTASYLAGAFLQYEGEEDRSETVGGLWWQLLNRADLGIVL